MEDPKKDSELESEYVQRIIKSWRTKFPKSSVTDENLSRKIHDLILNPSEELETPVSKRSKKAKTEPTEPDFDSLRKPNARGQMNWNKIAIRDLLQCHHSAQNEHKIILSNGQKPVTKLSQLVHEKLKTFFRLLWCFLLVYQLSWSFSFS